MTWDCKGRPFMFDIDEDLGAKTQMPFAGKLVDKAKYVDIDDKTADDQILIIDSERLRNLSHDTVIELMHARILITESSEGLHEIVQNLENEVSQNLERYKERSWEECFP